MIQTITSVADTDMHICAHINPAQLPTMLRDILSLAPSEAEKDMLLMATLTACGSVMPNVYFRYGVAAKRYYPNLQVFIVGSAASGKGIANLALDLVKPIDECTPILIPGDATYAAFYQQLAKQHGHGYIHESEGSVITDVWRRQQAANYNTALRKAAEHEPISRKPASWRSKSRTTARTPCTSRSTLPGAHRSTAPTPSPTSITSSPTPSPPKSEARALSAASECQVL